LEEEDVVVGTEAIEEGGDLVGQRHRLGAFPGWWRAARRLGLGRGGVRVE